MGRVTRLLRHIGAGAQRAWRNRQVRIVFTRLALFILIVILAPWIAGLWRILLYGSIMDQTIIIILAAAWWTLRRGRTQWKEPDHEPSQDTGDRKTTEPESRPAKRKKPHDRRTVADTTVQ